MPRGTFRGNTFLSNVVRNVSSLDHTHNVHRTTVNINLELYKFWIRSAAPTGEVSVQSDEKVTEKTEKRGGKEKNEKARLDARRLIVFCKVEKPSLVSRIQFYPFRTSASI